LNAIKVNHKELKDLVKLAYHSKRALIVVGGVGIGKSDSIRQASREIAASLKKEYSEDFADINNEDKFVLIEQRATRFDPSDIRGLPVFRGDDTVWLKPNWIPKKGYGIVFLEELTQAPPLIQNSLQSLLLTRAVEERKLPDGYGIIAATNRPEDDAATFEVPANIRNCLLWCELSPPSAEEWCEWAAENGVHGSVITAIYRNPSWLYDKDVTPEMVSFRRPRTWEFVSNIIQCCEKLGIEPNETHIATAIGQGAAIEFMAFLKYHKQMKHFKEYLDGKEDPPDKPDLLTALISNVVEHYRKNLNAGTLEKVVRLALKMKEPEFATMLVKFCKNVDKKKFTTLFMKIPSNKEFASRFGKYIL